MPPANWKPKLRKKGYRRFLCAPRKGCKPYKGNGNPILKDTLPNAATKDADADFLGFDVPPLTQGVRVMSLFDGIGAARCALDHLKVNVEEYFSSEIDSKAITVLKYHHHGKMKMVGCVKALTEEKLALYGPIHLLLGGSPCDDLSLCNPARRGEGSSGLLFYEFKRVRDFLSRAAEQNGHIFYWLLENTFAMEMATKQEISSELGCQPAVRCASYCAPMKRKRYFWGNIPNLYSPEPMLQGLNDLQDYIKPYRAANVQILPTLTGSCHSQRTGKEKILPVHEDGEDVPLLISEVESIFGFPRHYTDVNLSISDRRKLLGKSWCIPVIVDILKPLAEELKKSRTQ